MARVILLVHLTLSPLIFSPLSADVFEYPKVMLLRTAAILLLGLGASWLAGQVFTHRMSWERCRDSLRRDPIAWGVLAFLISAGISTAFSLSLRTSLIGAHESFLGLFHLLAWGVLFFATRATIAGFGEARWLLWATVLASVGACAYALIQLAGLDPIAWTRTSPYRGYARVFGTMGNPILLAGFLVTAFPVCAYVALNTWRRGRVAAAGVAVTAVILGWAVTLASFSRGAWIALVLAICTLLFGWWRTRERSGARVLLGGVIVGLALLLVGLFASAEDTILPERFIARAGSILSPGREPRLQAWPAAWQMFVQHPISGVGVDVFQLAFQQFRPATYWLVEWGGTPTRAHNEVLHVAATQGALGLAALVLLVGGLIMGWRRALRGARSLDEAGLLVAIGAGLIGFGAQSLFSFTVAGTGTLFVTYAALVSRLSFIAPEPGHSDAGMDRYGLPPLILARVVVLGGVLFALIHGVLNPLRANSSFQKGRVLGLQGKPAAAIPHITRALERGGERQLYWLELCSAHYAAAMREQACDQKRTHLNEARRAVSHAIELEPLDGHGYANLGLSLLELAKLDPPAASPDQVFQAFDRALAIDNTNAHFLLEAARAALTLGELDRAQYYAARNRDHYPDYARARLQLGRVAIGRSNWESAVSEFEAALVGKWHGEPDTVAAWTGLARARLDLGQPEEALRAAHEAVTRAPENAEAWTQRGRAQETLALRPGESSERLRLDAIHSYGRAFLLDPGHPIARAGLDRLVPKRGPGT